MGALWSTTDGDAPEERGSLLAALLRAIDLRRLSPYHASAAGKTRGREHGPSAGRAVRIGGLLPADERVRGHGAQGLSGGGRVFLHTGGTPSRAAPAFALGA